MMMMMEGYHGQSDTFAVRALPLTPRWWEGSPCPRSTPCFQLWASRDKFPAGALLKLHHRVWKKTSWTFSIEA